MLGTVLSLLLSPMALGFAENPSAEEPASDAAFRGEPFRSLQAEALQRFPDLSAEEAVRLVRENFRHVYANCVKESRFLVKPNNQRIAARTLEILRLQRDLSRTLARARRSLAARAEPTRGRAASIQVSLVREAGRTGRKIRDIFRENFLDMSHASFQMTLGTGRNSFLMFLLEAERINRLLSQEMERYFLRDRPGIVAVGDYERPSIGVLGDALAKLAKISEEQLDR